MSPSASGYGPQIIHIYEFGPFRVDTTRRVLLRDGQPLPLHAKTFDTLLALLESRGQTVRKDTLMDQVWSGVAVEESNLTHHISALRKALGDSPDEHRYVITIPGKGYRFVAGVKELLAEEGDVVERHTRSHIVIGEQQTNGHPSTDSACIGQRLINWKRVVTLTILVVVAAATVLIAVKTREFIRQDAARRTLASGLQKFEKTRLTANIDVRLAAISPDAKYVVYSVHAAGRDSLWLRQVAVANSQQIVPPSEVRYSMLTFSSDGNFLYFTAWDKDDSVFALYRMPALGGASNKLLTDVEGFTISPDGSRIAFIRNSQLRGESALMIASADGTHEQKLAARDLATPFSSPSWSPDSRLIVGAVGTADTGGSEMGLVVIEVNDGTERSVTAQKWEYIRQVAWLPDASGVVMVARNHASPLSQVWHLSYPGAEARSIADDSNYYFFSLAADSRTLATVQRVLNANIWVLPNGDASRAYQTAHAFGGLSWMPDGRIVYASLAGGNQDVWIMNADGGGQKQLTADANKNASPAISPDGRYIVFVSARTGRFHVWRMNNDGSDPVQLTNGGGENMPTISPNGRWVVYTSVTDWTLQKVSIDGGEPVKLTDGHAFWPSISPDGKWIAYFRFETSPQQRYEVAVVPFEGGEPVKIFHLGQKAPTSLNVRWTPDGNALAYVVDRNDVSNIWIQPLDGNPPKQITNFTFDQISNFGWSPDGRYLACERGAFRGDVVLLRSLR
jgi:eukaryotic-like serine/threonine-protein kinase